MRNCSLRVSVCLALTATLSGFSGAGEEKLETRVEVKQASIKPSIRYEFSRQVGSGRLVKAQDGQQGSVKKTYRVTYKNGKPVSKELLKEERTEAEPTLYLMGRSGWTTSRSSFSRAKVMTMHASAYDPSPETIGPGATGRTRMGLVATYGHVAVDPRVIPLGSLVFVEGYGFAIASDTGGAIKGNRIDLCYDDRSTALRFGRRTVKVHVFSKR
jgi:3D (Asp-Asp-Asp) domain-containing protein